VASVVQEPEIATWGICHGRGILGDLIREAEFLASKGDRFPNGDAEAAWAGHIVVYAGGGRIIEAEWPRVKYSSALVHPEVIWVTGQPLDGAQRSAGQISAVASVGEQYDAVSYAYFMAKLAEFPISKDYDALAKLSAKAGPICSGLMIRTQIAMNVDLGPLKAIATDNPDFISPANCYRWALDNGWL
jgi:hypothetical protein